MASIDETCDNVLAAYDDCVYWYAMLKQRRTRLRVKNLVDAFVAVADYMMHFSTLLYKENIPEGESWLLSKWQYEEYFHDDRYICPDYMLKEIFGMMEKEGFIKVFRL